MASPRSDTRSWWSDGRRETPIPSPWVASPSASSEVIADRLAEEMARAWRRDERVSAEEMLARHPRLAGEAEVALRLIYEEFCLRQDRGEDLSPQQFIRRFPRWETELKALLESHDALEHWLDTLDWPEPGRPLGDFTLLDELGRGGRGRIYLAVQPLLADRPVVLKVTPRDGTEHLALAKLQHTHIVPLYSVEDFPDRGLRALCMPYLGGVTLARLLEGWSDRPVDRRSGRDFVEALERAEASAVLKVPGRGPARRSLARGSYEQAVCAIVACLADALHYAHERGLVHLDLKPSNVLIAGDGQPMLLDFHLAQGPIAPEAPPPDRLGGTMGYMAPEHREALDAILARRPILAPVDARADVYSLGMILHEMLGGAVRPARGPVQPRPRARLRGVSAGLAAIIAKCLEPKPAGRYPDASALAADLRRHLADLPLAGVPNRNLPERWRKWRRRRPYALGSLVLLLAVSAGLVATGVAANGRVRHRLGEARAALAVGEDQARRHHYADAIQTFERGLSAATRFPGDRDLSLILERSLRNAREAEAVRQLEDVAERARFIRDLDGRTAAELRPVADSCRAVWDSRGWIAGLATPRKAKAREDLVDVVVLLADVGVRLAPTGGDVAARREAIGLLDALEREFGPSLVLELGRRAIAEAPAAAPLPAARTAREHEAVGRYLLRSGDLAAAAAAFDRAIELAPNAFWPNFSQGLCAYRARRFEDAATAFRVCIALAPEAVPCYFNRALAYLALGQPDLALRDYDRALRLEPSHPQALLGRGVLHLHQRRLREAVVDLEHALAAGADPIAAHLNLALAYRARGESRPALAHLEQVLHRDPSHREAREARDRLRAARHGGGHRG